MDEGSEGRLIPTESDRSLGGTERWRRFLVRRRQDGVASPFDVNEDVAALAQMLADSTEAHLLALDEGHKRIERLSVALQPAEEWAESRRRLESVADDWDARLTAAREGWMRAADEIPRQVAQATAQVLRSGLEENRAALRYLLAVAALLSLLLSVTAFWSWRVYALLTDTTAPPVTEARPNASSGNAVRPAAMMKAESDPRRKR